MHQKSQKIFTLKSRRVSIRSFWRDEFRDTAMEIQIGICEVHMIGNIVTVKVDRPMGSYHPEHKDLYYPINYGYIEEIIAPDGEKQDAYLLGLDKPVQEYTGIIIAIIHRYDDVEEKWVVAPKGMMFTKAEIKEKTYFQEQYFESEVRM